VTTKRPWLEQTELSRLPRQPERRHEPSWLLQVDWTTLMLKFVAAFLVGVLLVTVAWFSWRIHHLPPPVYSYDSAHVTTR
jgi:hypothetical protein